MYETHRTRAVIVGIGGHALRAALLRVPAAAAVRARVLVVGRSAGRRAVLCPMCRGEARDRARENEKDRERERERASEKD